MFFKSFCASIFFAFLSLIFVSCDKLFSESNSVNARAVFSDIKLEPKNSSNRFSVLILSDIHFPSSKRAEHIASLIENHLMPSQSEILFCAILGDISQQSKESEYIEFQKFRQRLENCEIKVFTVPGNHDTIDKGKNYLKYVDSKTFYRVLVSDFSFYFLDTADNFLGETQYNLLQNLLPCDNNKKIFFTHQPIYTTTILDKMFNFRERAKIVSMISNTNTEYYFCGHTHTWETYKFGNMTEVVINGADDDLNPGYVILSIDEIGNCSYKKYYFD